MHNTEAAIPNERQSEKQDYQVSGATSVAVNADEVLQQENSSENNSENVNPLSAHRATCFRKHNATTSEPGALSSFAWDGYEAAGWRAEKTTSMSESAQITKVTWACWVDTTCQKPTFVFYRLGSNKIAPALSPHRSRWAVEVRSSEAQCACVCSPPCVAMPIIDL